MGRLAEMQRKLLEVRFFLILSQTFLMFVSAANDGSRGDGCSKRKPSLVR